MSARPRTTTTSKPKGERDQARRGAKGAPRRPNRAQQQAMEIRSAATGFAQPVAAPEDETTVIEPAYVPRVSAPQTRGAAKPRARAAARPVVMSKEQEYRFIHADLRRLLITAGALLLLMLVLLFLIER